MDTVLDKIDWHYKGDYPKDLSRKNAGTHIGMFLAWIILNGLEGEELQEDSQISLQTVREEKMTGREFLEKECDGKLSKEDLSKESVAFASYYYCTHTGYGQYISDYEQILVGELPSFYHVQDTWENYRKLEPYISSAYKLWKLSHKH